MKFDRPSRGYGSYHSGINGVSNYLQKFERFRMKPSEPNKFYSKLGTLMICYLKEKQLEHKSDKRFSSMDFNANVIQNDFKSFRQWIDTNEHLTFKDSL